MIQVKNKITVYEINDKECKLGSNTIEVRNHWNNKRIVVIEVAGNSYAVSASDLEAAISNATNTNY